MPRMMAGKRSELESFWRAHLDGWRRSDLNQREYCELHGLPLKRFGNWRAGGGSLPLAWRGRGWQHAGFELSSVVDVDRGHRLACTRTPMAARCSWLSRTQLVEKMRDTPVEPAPCGYGLFKHEPVALAAPASIVQASLRGCPRRQAPPGSVPPVSWD